MITYTTAKTDTDLKEILALQQKNLTKSLSGNEATREGFVTVEHDLRVLRLMNVPYPHILAKAKGKVVGYALTMLKETQIEVPILKPLFDSINEVIFEGVHLAKANYLVMGQICIDKAFRQMGIFKNLYRNYAAQFAPHFDYVITEVSARNNRSLNAHLAAGFEIIHTHEEEGQKWIMIWLKLK